MSLARYITEDSVRMEMLTTMPSVEEREETPRETWLPLLKEQAIRELSDLLSASPEVRKAHKLYQDLHNREKQWTTALGKGVAFPHVRTIHTRSLVFALARSTEGLDFGAPDGEPVHFFMTMVTPPYEDTIYLRYAKRLAEAIEYGGLVEKVQAALNKWELIRIVDALI
jgi:mannitol/fructose-specific phosphotransferase system IIA component (Ntr-type)